MLPHRLERAAEAIRETLASAILFDMADPRVKGVTVIRAEVAPDLRAATVYISVLGSPGEQKEALKALARAKGFLQSKLGDRLQTRNTPILSFKQDDSIKKSIEFSQLIEQVIAESPRFSQDDSSELGQEQPNADENL